MALQKALLLTHLQQIYLFFMCSKFLTPYIASSIDLIKVGLKYWNIDVVVVTREKHIHDMVDALDVQAYTDNSPLGNIFRRKCIAIMASTIEKKWQAELQQCNWQLPTPQSPRPVTDVKEPVAEAVH